MNNFTFEEKNPTLKQKNCRNQWSKQKSYF